MRGVFVVGMHSGGTSAAALALMGLGLNGPADPQQSPEQHPHPQGIAESTSMMELNNKLLASFGTTWTAGGRRKSPRLPPGWPQDPRAVACRGEAAAALGDAYPLEPWAYKDPRLCILLPFWRLVAGDLAALLIVRHPVACARSLALRNRLSFGQGLKMWAYHLGSAAVGLAGLPVLVTSYEAAVGHPGSWCESVAVWLAGLGLADAPGRVAEAQKVIVAGARHQTVEPGDDSVLTDRQARLYGCLLEAAGAHAAWRPPAALRASPCPVNEAQIPAAAGALHDIAGIRPEHVPSSAAQPR
jgi:hypothetical protein